MQNKFISSMLFILTVLWFIPAYADCAAPVGVTGELEYNTGTNEYEYCNGTTWETFTLTNLGACNPPVKTAEMQYGTASSKYYFCDGTDYQEIECFVPDITSGLAGHWALDETSGTTAVDSVSANNGTMASGLDATNDSLDAKIKSGLGFDGTDDYIDLSSTAGSLLNNVSAATASAWINVNSLSNQNVIGFSKGGGVTSDSRYTIEITPTGDVKVGGRSNDADSYSGYQSSSTPISTGTWIHLAGVVDYSNDRVDLYVNGLLEGSKTSAGFSQATTSATDSSSVAIGGEDDGTGSKFIDGIIDDVRIYDRVLSASEISALYNIGNHCPNPVSFDGTNDVLLRGGDLTGNADSKLVTGSFWIRTDELGNVTDNIYHVSSGHFRIQLSGSGNATSRDINIFGTSGATLDVFIDDPIPDNEWHHILFSFDMGNSSSRHVYVDGVDASPTYNTYIDSIIDFTRPEHAIGGSTGGIPSLPADMADFWIDFGTYIDLSVLSNREKFYNNGPVNLGISGSIPTGSDPDIFLSGDTASWHTNKGAGGGFTENGALTDGTIKICDNTCGISSTGCTKESAIDVIGGRLSYCNGSDNIIIAE